MVKWMKKPILRDIDNSQTPHHASKFASKFLTTNKNKNSIPIGRPDTSWLKLDIKPHSKLWHVKNIVKIISIAVETWYYYLMFPTHFDCDMRFCCKKFQRCGTWTMTGVVVLHRDAMSKRRFCLWIRGQACARHSWNWVAAMGSHLATRSRVEEFHCNRWPTPPL